jgi:hypothetical protein
MSLEAWKRNGWLREYSTSSQEVSGILALVERDLSEAKKAEITADWRFNIAYNAGLQLVTLVMYVAGYRAGQGESKHYRAIQALPLIMGTKFESLRDYLDNCRRKRNRCEYDTAGCISGKEVEDILEAVSSFKGEVEGWLQKKAPDLSF